MEVATVDETKKQLLSDIFWEMNDISSRTELKTHTEIEESDDGHGNIVQTETTVTETFLYITVSHKTVDEMAAMYGFNQEQKDYLAELLQDENNQLWSQVLYGIGYSDDQIVTVALSQVGNVGGQPYWSWYGFDSRVEWCACFVSWCANECGYIDAGIIPKYAGNQFTDRCCFHCIGSNRNTGKDSAEESCCKQNEEIQYSRKVRQNINLNSIKSRKHSNIAHSFCTLFRGKQQYSRNRTKNKADQPHSFSACSTHDKNAYDEDEQQFCTRIEP